MAKQIPKFHDRIYQLDELILDVYNAVYAKSSGYRIKFIGASDMIISRFKLTDYDLDQIFDKSPTKYVGTFPTGLRYDGKSVDQICIKRQGDSHMTTIRLIPYHDEKTINSLSNPVNVNQIIKTLLSELVANGRTNNVILPVINIDVKGSDISDYSNIEQPIDVNKYYSIEITEKFYGLMTLEKFLKSQALEPSVIKTIIFQAVDVLYQITSSFPKFRHNQFIPEMIDCYLKKTGSTVYPELKVNNFFLSEIKDVVKNDYLSNNVTIPFINSIYSDLYQLLNWMWNNIQTDLTKYDDIVKIFDVILPKKIRSNEKYLTVEMWNSLSDTEKDILDVKNIRNNTFFTSKDFQSGSSMIESNDINDLLGGVKEINAIPDEKTDDKHQRVSLVNKKSSRNDIDHMPQTKNKETLKSQSSYEKKESKENNVKKYNKYDNEDNTKQSRNRDDEHIKPRKSYKGTRIINTYCMNNQSKNNHSVKPVQTSSMSRNVVPERDTWQDNHSDNYNQFVPNQFQQHEQYTGKMNSIGNALGITPGEMNGMPNYSNQMDYMQMNQIPQQTNPMSQMNPMTQMNPMSQMQMNPMMNQQYSQFQPEPNQQMLDSNAMAKYMSALGQTGQNIDSNMFGYMNQQNQMQSSPQYQMVPSNYSQQSMMPQTGGAMQNKRGPFFFQPIRSNDNR